uniref:Uncharacterized protein n=1 Tax=Arundo donax TaxID=35708 RepID=A0A0A8ZKB6_ARUDO
MSRDYMNHCQHVQQGDPFHH